MSGVRLVCLPGARPRLGALQPRRPAGLGRPQPPSQRGQVGPGSEAVRAAVGRSVAQANTGPSGGGSAKQGGEVPATASPPVARRRIALLRPSRAGRYPPPQGRLLLPSL